MNPFRQQFRADSSWHPVGLASSFPDLDLDKDAYRIAPRCKAFRIPKTKGPEGPVAADLDLPGDLKEQVLVFKYKGQLHAIDHVSTRCSRSFVELH
jgi:hypothetical protein